MTIRMTNPRFRNHVANVRSEDQALWAAQGWLVIPDEEPPVDEAQTPSKKVKK